jgi:hypothetical protein
MLDVQRFLLFESEQLHAIFNAPLYPGCIDGGRGYDKAGNQRPCNARLWVPSSHFRSRVESGA